MQLFDNRPCCRAAVNKGCREQGREGICADPTNANVKTMLMMVTLMLLTQT